MWIWSFFLLNRQSFYFFFPPPYSSKHKSFFKLVLKLLGTKSFLIPKTTLNMELDNCNLWTVPGTWMKQVWKLSQNFLEVYNQGHLHVQSHISKNIITIKLYFRHRAFLIAQLIKNLPAVQKTPPFDSWVRKIRWRRDRLPTPVFLGFHCGSAGKESACSAGDLDSIPGLGRSPGVGKGYPL